MPRVQVEIAQYQGKLKGVISLNSHKNKSISHSPKIFEILKTGVEGYTIGRRTMITLYFGTFEPF